MSTTLLMLATPEASRRAVSQGGEGWMFTPRITRAVNGPQSSGAGPAQIRVSWELAQEAHITLEKNLDIVDAVFEHGQPIDAHAESEAADFFRVVIHEAVHGGVDHAGTEQLNPAGAFAFRADAAARGRAAAPAKDTGDIEFHGGLGEREIAGAKARFYARAKKLLHEILDGAGEIAA